MSYSEKGQMYLLLKFIKIDLLVQTYFSIWNLNRFMKNPDPTVYNASYISFAPGADETQRNFSWYSPKQQNLVLLNMQK